MSEQDEDVVDNEQVEDDETGGAEQLGDAGKRALDSMKGKWQAERDRRKATEAELAKLRDGQKATQQTEVEKAREAGKAEARAEVLKERALDRVETKAAKLFADPEDARALLASKVDDFVDGDKVDGDAIDKALADLLKRKPHLGVQNKRFEGSADGGARKGSRPEQLTQQDLNKMTPDQIVEARRKGQFDDLMGVQT
jgi:hypothetical protein